MLCFFEMLFFSSPKNTSFHPLRPVYSPICLPKIIDFSSLKSFFFAPSSLWDADTVCCVFFYFFLRKNPCAWPPFLWYADTVLCFLLKKCPPVLLDADTVCWWKGNSLHRKPACRIDDSACMRHSAPRGDASRPLSNPQPPRRSPRWRFVWQAKTPSNFYYYYF